LDKENSRFTRKEKNDAFNYYDQNPFVKISRLFILDSHRAQVTYNRHCLHLLANQPSYIEDMKIFTRKREDYQNFASRLRIQNKVRPSCLFYAHELSPRLPRAPGGVVTFCSSDTLCASRNCTIVSCASRSCCLSQVVFPSRPCGTDTSRFFATNCRHNSLFSW
jgi:hypothetical protein